MVLQPIGCGRVGHRHNTTKPEGRHRHTACRPSPLQPPPARHRQPYQLRYRRRQWLCQWLRYQQRHERQRTTPARLAIHECRMQFPQHRAAPRNHTVGIATLTHTIENSPNRIACKTTPSARTSTYVGPMACAWAPHRPEPRPHRHQTGGVALHEDPCATCLPVTSPPNGGNCTIRGATRRRHTDRTLLILQNPPSSPGCGGVAEVNCVPESPASQNIWAIMPMPAIVRRGGLHCGRRCPEA